MTKVDTIIDSGGSLVDVAVRRIREYIHSNGLKVGDTLPGEAAFATEFGVSRAVMREAFGALAALKLLDVANGRRARVGAIDGSVMAMSLDHALSTDQISIADIWEVRRSLELSIVQLAAVRRTDPQAFAILAAADAMIAKREDLDDVTRHDVDFHQAISRASGNQLYLQIIRAFEPLMRVAVPTAWRTLMTDEQRWQMLKHHRRIAETILDRDPEAAFDAMNSHFDASVEAVLKADAMLGDAVVAAQAASAL